MHRAFIAGLLAIGSIGSWATLAAARDFWDVPDSHPYAAAIEALGEEGLMTGQGDGSFRPDQTLNRAELTTVVMRHAVSSSRQLDCLEEEESLPYDVREWDWFAPAVCAAADRGIIRGYPDGTFRPGRAINMAEAVTILARAWDLEMNDADPWFVPAYAALHARGAIPGGVWTPERTVTRAEFAYMFATLLEDDDQDDDHDEDDDRDGDDEDDDHNNDERSSSSSSFSWLSSSSFASSSQGPLQTRDVSYGSDPLQRLDIYNDPNASNRPVLFLVHGGSWISGDKEHFGPIADYLRGQGYVAVSVNYRLTSESGNAYPIPVNDVACALAWTKQNIARYGGDPSRIVTFGHSAGGHIGALLAYKPEGDWLSGCATQNVSLDVDGFIGSGGVYDFDAIIEGHRQPMKMFLGEKYGAGKWDEAEPSNFVNASNPPALLVAGGEDNYDVIGARVMADALAAASVQHRLITPQGFQHATFVERLPTHQTAQQVVREFLESVF